LLTLSLLAVPSVARANDAVAAQTLFDEGKQLMADGNYTAACSKFADSQRADPGLGTQFHLADCWQHVGRMASAWALFRDIESQAHARGETGRERVAHDRASALEPFLPRLAIQPHEGDMNQGLRILRDGTEIGREQWGVAVPIDPGAHTVAVYVAGKQPWGTAVEVPVDAKITAVDLPPVSTFQSTAVAASARPAPATPAAAPQPGPTPPASSPGVASMMPETTTPPPETPTLENHGGVQRGIGWFLVGLGAAGVGSSTYFITQWLSYRSQADPHCAGDQCDPVGTQLHQNATTQGHAAIIAGAGGAVALIVGGLLVATAPGPRVVSTPAARVQVVPILEAHQGGVGLSGAW
jgi:hypothetical protein